VKVVGVFVRFSCASLAEDCRNIDRNYARNKKTGLHVLELPSFWIFFGSYSSSNSFILEFSTIVNGVETGNQNPTLGNGRRKGYIIRTPWGHTDGNTYAAKFTGPPNNGNI
jgi:hypothetical protein